MSTQKTVDGLKKENPAVYSSTNLSNSTINFKFSALVWSFSRANINCAAKQLRTLLRPLIHREKRVRCIDASVEKNPFVERKKVCSLQKPFEINSSAKCDEEFFPRSHDE